jgi:hypothetical protein
MLIVCNLIASLNSFANMRGYDFRTKTKHRLPSHQGIPHQTQQGYGVAMLETQHLAEAFR